MTQAALTVGVLADTHLPYRLKALPEQIKEIFKDVDLILHAGDVDRLECLSPLADVAPIYAVRGNVHFGDWSDGGRDLPLTVELTLAGRNVILTHGHLTGWRGWVSKVPHLLFYDILRPRLGALNHITIRHLARQHPQADVVVFGHTHAACCLRRNGTLFFNPGPVATVREQVPSVGLLRFSPETVTGRIVPLR
ncbi:MAG: metallophosphoesterase family protein [Anaerolineae bacterium]